MLRPDYYSILGVGPDSTPAQISRAYRTLMRAHHPDVGDAPADLSELLRIMEAFAVLRNPARRAQYDLRLTGQQKREQAAAEQGNKEPDAGSSGRGPRAAARGQARNVPVRHGIAPARSRGQQNSADIRITPVRWESGPWA